MHIDTDDSLRGGLRLRLIRPTALHMIYLNTLFHDPSDQ